MKTDFLLAIILTVLSQSVIAQDVKEKIEYKTDTAIQYYSEETMKGDNYMQEMCVFDFYYPTNIKDFPTIVWFHGGGLTQGKRSIPEYLKNRGFAIIGVDYRLSPKVKAVECIKDAGLKLNLRCPLDGEYKIGDTWAETH